MKMKESLSVSISPHPKKARLNEIEELPFEFVFCQKLLRTTSDEPLPPIPPSLYEKGKTKNDLHKLRTLMDSHGFRTSVVASPRLALSIYKDSCRLDATISEAMVPGKEYLVIMFGLHPKQKTLERFYTAFIKSIYCLLLFCKRLREACPEALEDEHVAKLVAENEADCREIGMVVTLADMQKATMLCVQVAERVATLIQAAIKADSRIRVEQLEREYSRITLWSSSLSNSLVYLFLNAHNCCIKDVFYKRSHSPKYERITVYLYDPEIDQLKPPQFLFLPSLNTALEGGPEAVVKEMIQSFWSHLLRHGYFATPTIKQAMSPDLEAFFLSGISHDPTIPLKLNANFDPNRSLSFYLHGKAGAGKSSLVRNICPALEATITEHVDPEILARFVKQNLNKPYHVLQLELDLRPNNNDLSVMSIIQGRRMTMAQSKPGLVVVDMEEMPSNDPEADPNQLKLAQLISQRFSGRKGDYKEGSAVPRNSDKRGIQGDASLVTLFTSNYELDTPSCDALKKLKMFQNICIINVEAVSGEDRKLFAESYLVQCIKDRFSDLGPACHIDLTMPFGNGDTRPLVRHLRMVAFYICGLVSEDVRKQGIGKASIDVSVVQTGKSCFVKQTKGGTDSVELQLGSLDNLFPLTYQVFDQRVKRVIDVLKEGSWKETQFSELSIILDFWLAKTLAPAVIVSQDETKLKKLIEVIKSSMDDVRSITDVDAGEYKMMKSLYDPNDTPNLRDDILTFGRGAHVAIGISCPTKDSQLCIREIIEDSPSMTAFSTSKSALYKEGLLFAIHVEGDVTPEVASRASYFL